MKTWGLFLLLVLALISCSAPKSSEDVSGDSIGLDVSENEEDMDLFADEDSDEQSLDMMSEMAELDGESGPVGDATADAKPISKKLPFVESDMALQEYKVEKGDTLMLIAFKLFGDYSKWSEVLKANEGLDVKKLKPGVSISYYSNGEVFEWNPQGLPYLIKWGDTLGLISNNVYGVKKKWRMIWDNNKPMIKDPNKIYAGFTLYYPEEDRGVASK